MMKTHLLAASAAALMLAGAAQAQPAGPGGGFGGGMRQAANLDLDHDGKVTPAEFRKVEDERVARMFGRLDANHDGKIARPELEAARQRMAAMRGAQAGPMNGGDFFFRFNDLNGDGVVTRAEMEKALERRFQTADTNHDGWLSKGELIMMRQRARGPGQ